MSGKNWDRVPIDAQSVDAPLSLSAVFLVVTVASEQSALAKVASVLGELDDLVKTVGFRDLGANCRASPASAATRGIVFADPPPAGAATVHADQGRRPLGAVDAGRPAVPHPRRPRRPLLRVRAPPARRASATPSRGRRGERVPLLRCPRPARLRRRHREPDRRRLAAAALIGDEDPTFAGGSYVVVQKYLHDLAAWDALPTEQQEAVIGRTKTDNVELDDDRAAQIAQDARTITDDDGNELEILRDNMPFGSPAPASSAPTSSATPAAVGDRADAAAHVHRRPAGPTTGSSTSPPPSPARRSSCQPAPCCRRLSRTRSSNFPPRGKATADGLYRRRSACVALRLRHLARLASAEFRRPDQLRRPLVCHRPACPCARSANCRPGHPPAHFASWPVPCARSRPAKPEPPVAAAVRPRHSAAASPWPAPASFSCDPPSAFDGDSRLSPRPCRVFHGDGDALRSVPCRAAPVTA